MYKTIAKCIAWMIAYFVAIMLETTWMCDLFTAQSTICVALGVGLLFLVLATIIIPPVYVITKWSNSNDEQVN